MYARSWWIIALRLFGIPSWIALSPHWFLFIINVLPFLSGLLPRLSFFGSLLLHVNLRHGSSLSKLRRSQIFWLKTSKVVILVIFYHFEGGWIALNVDCWDCVFLNLGNHTRSRPTSHRHLISRHHWCLLMIFLRRAWFRTSQLLMGSPINPHTQKLVGIGGIIFKISSDRSGLEIECCHLDIGGFWHHSALTLNHLRRYPFKPNSRQWALRTRLSRQFRYTNSIIESSCVVLELLELCLVLMIFQHRVGFFLLYLFL